MNKRFLPLLSLLLIFLLGSCASNQVVEKSDAPELNNQQNEKKLRFDDWKYKGFGNELPEWVTFAVDNQLEEIKKTDSSLESAVIEVFTGKGDNSDQADQAAKQAALQAFEASGAGSDWKLYDSFWVRETDVNELPYIGIYLYIQK